MQVRISDPIYVGDVVRMRKAHPCGGVEWEVTRVGADVGMLCLTCKRRVMLSRRDFTRQVKSFINRPALTGEESGGE